MAAGQQTLCTEKVAQIYTLATAHKKQSCLSSLSTGINRTFQSFELKILPLLPHCQCAPKAETGNRSVGATADSTTRVLLCIVWETQEGIQQIMINYKEFSNYAFPSGKGRDLFL